MSKKKTNLEQKKQLVRDYKKGIKRLWICVACLIPFVILLTYIFAVIGMQVWLAVFLNVVIGGFICLIVYIVFDKIDKKKQIRDMLEPEEKDPISD